MLDQVGEAVASFTAHGAYGTGAVSAAVAGRHPDAAIIVPPRSTAMPSDTAPPHPTQRERHLQGITNNGRASWRKSSGCNKRPRVEAAIGRFKQVIGKGLHSQTDARQNIEIVVAVHVLNRMLEFGRPTCVRIV